METEMTLYHFEKDVDTLSDFMDRNHIVGIEASDLFEQNREAIFNQLSTDQKAGMSKEAGREITKDDINYTMTLPKPCILKIESKYVERELAISQTSLQEQSDDVFAFADNYIQSILQNDGYVINVQTRKKTVGCNVWGWFKSKNILQGNEAGVFNSSNKRDSVFDNISDYVISVDTNVTVDGGSFTIVLPIISATEYFGKKIVEGYKSEIGLLLQNSVKVIKDMDNILFDEQNSFFHKTGMSVSSCDNYFNWLIQSNDLIFISFDRLQIEEDVGSAVFDMIGLVENVVVNMESSGSGRVTINGKDLMKLVTDDNSLFFNSSTVWGENQIFVDSNGNMGDMRSIDLIGGKYNPMDRLRRSTNEIDIFATPFNKTISFIIKGVISQLANIRIVPDYVFNSWGESRTKFNSFSSEDDSTNNADNEDSEFENNKEFEK